MSDLDRYLTDEVVEKAARAEWESEWPDRPWEKTPDDLRDFYMSVARTSLSAVLPDIIRQAKAEALRKAAEEFWARLPDGTGNGRAYNSHRVADMLRARADEIAGEQ